MAPMESIACRLAIGFHSVKVPHAALVAASHSRWEARLPRAWWLNCSVRGQYLILIPDKTCSAEKAQP